MQFFQNKVMRILFLIMLAALIPAMWLTWQRNQVETAARTVEMVYDYDNILDNAAVEKKSVDDLYELYRKSGITSLAIYDETPEKLLAHGQVRFYTGAGMQAETGNDPEVHTDRVYLQPSNQASGAAIFKEVKQAVSDRFRPEDVRFLQIRGVDTIEVNASYKNFAEMPLGIFQNDIKTVTDNGFYAVLRPKNTAHMSKEAIDTFLEAVDSSPKVSAVLFQGKEVLGHKDQEAYVTEELKKRHVPVVLIEAQNQLGFEPQEGILDMARNMDYQNVRLYAMSKEELIKLTQDEASARFYISDIERNIRMNLFPSYKDAKGGESLSETNARYIGMVKERLENHGFSIGKASIMESYFPSRVLRACVMIGASALAVMVLVMLIPFFKSYALAIFGLLVLATQGLYWGTQSLLPLQALALAVEIGTPVFVVSLFLDYCVSRKNEAEKSFSMGHIFLESLTILWVCGLFVLLTASYVSGLLGDIRFFLEMAIFRGVKVTFVMPIILISLIYIQKFPFFGKPVTTDKDFVTFVRKFCGIPIKMGLLMLLGVLAVVGLIFVGRSGNNGAPVPQFEVALRRFLEDNMYARPREKEFLFGHPALLFAMTALYRRWPQILHYLFVLAFTIGQGSMIETFAHMRSPYILSLIRGLDGLAAGSCMMVLALIGIVILIRITKFFGGRYGKA